MCTVYILKCYLHLKPELKKTTSIPMYDARNNDNVSLTDLTKILLHLMQILKIFTLLSG